MPAHASVLKAPSIHALRFWHKLSDELRGGEGGGGKQAAKMDYYGLLQERRSEGTNEEGGTEKEKGISVKVVRMSGVRVALIIIYIIGILCRLLN